MSLPHLDPARVPVSARGSWMSLSIDSNADAPRGPGVYLRTNRYRPVALRHVFRIVPLADLSGLRTEASPGAMTIHDPESGGTTELEVLFDGISSVRIIAQSPIRLESAFAGSSQRENARHAVAYPLGERRFVVNAKSWLRRYGIHVLRGTATLDAPWDGEVSIRADLDLVPDPAGVVEIAIDEFASTWVEYERLSAALIRRKLTADSRAFSAGFRVTDKRRRTSDAAATVLWMCTQSPAGIMRHEAIFMSLNWMDSVWSWDNWINMIPLTRSEPDLAYAQYSVVADHQDEYGAYPDAVNDGFIHFNFSKPPIQGVIIDLITARDPEFWNIERMGSVYDSLQRFTTWWLTYRRFQADHLCHYLHGNDSGWDNGTLLRCGVPVVTPDLNAFLVRQCRTLARWARALGQPETECLAWDKHATELREALVQELWRDDHFVARHVPSGEDVDSVSLATVLPLVIAEELPPRMVDSLIERLDRFTTEWGLASEAPDSLFYEAENYWRGPVWAPTTLIAVHALRRIHEHERATRITERYMTLVENGGFAENFNAETGAPLVDPGYTWTAAVYLLFAEDEARAPHIMHQE